jgi:hypothetical protein
MILLYLWACSCGEEPTPPQPAPVAPVPPPAPVEKAPELTLRLPTQEGSSPKPIALSPELTRTRAKLVEVVEGHARDPGNPWAIVHGMLALGPTMKLSNDADPVDWMFEHYGEVHEVGNTELIGFPTRKDEALVEPHTDLILKALTESRVAPDRKITVGGKAFPVESLYRHSLWRAWVDGRTTGYQQGGYNDTPWALQALSAWAPAGLAWTARGGHAMSMDTFTHEVVTQLDLETQEMQAAKAAGQLVQKDTRKGLFRYTCGGQHLLQGAAYAVARGFGVEQDKAAVCEQLAVLRWRIDVELAAIDPILQSPEATRPLQVVLLSQRLKFLGHWLETTHKIGALSVCPLGPDDEAATRRVATELVRTVDALAALGIWENLLAVAQDPELETLRNGGGRQVYLDLVGDSAHAVRGLDLATGKGTVPF